MVSNPDWKIDSTCDVGVTLSCDVYVTFPVTWASHIPEGEVHSHILHQNGRTPAVATCVREQLVTAVYI